MHTFTKDKACIDSILTKYSASLQNYVDATQQLQNSTVEALQGVADFCSINIDVTAYTQTINGAIEVLWSELELFNQSLNDLNQANAAVQSVVVRVNDNFVYTLVYWVPLLVITCLLMAVFFLVWRGFIKGKLLRVQRFIIIPLFCLWIILSWLLALVFFVGVLVNAGKAHLYAFYTA